MTPLLVVFNLLVLTFTAVVCIGQTLWRRGLRQIALGCLGVLILCVAVAQLLLLLGHPASERVAVVAVGCVFQLVYFGALLSGRFDDEPGAREWAALPREVRQTIRDHPEVLAALVRRFPDGTADPR